MSLALVAAVLLLLLALAPASAGFFRRNLRHLRTALALAAAPLLIGLSVWGAASGGRFGDMKMSVLEVALGRSVLQTEGLSVGGSNRDDVVTPGLPAGLLRIARGDNGAHHRARRCWPARRRPRPTLGVIELAGKDGSALPRRPAVRAPATSSASPTAPRRPPSRYRLAADKDAAGGGRPPRGRPADAVDAPRARHHRHRLLAAHRAGLPLARLRGAAGGGRRARPGPLQAPLALSRRPAGAQLHLPRRVERRCGW